MFSAVNYIVSWTAQYNYLDLLIRITIRFDALIRYFIIVHMFTIKLRRSIL